MVRVSLPCGCIALTHNWFRLGLFDRRSDVRKASCANKRYTRTHSAPEAALSGFDVRDFYICLKMVNEPIEHLSSMLLGRSNEGMAEEKGRKNWSLQWFLKSLHSALWLPDCFEI